jgi:radical SAM superfamily enzyme YgiQ (UPF0313 family)
MKISLIQPKHLCGPDRIYEPLSLGYIASYLKQKGYVDIRIHSATFESDRQIITLAAAADVVGITAMSPMMTHASVLISEIKKRNSKIIVVVGGVHPSALPEVVLKNNNIDFVVRGEGEITFCELVEAIEGKRSIEEVPGISYRKNGEVIHNQARELIENLDTIPYPARDLLGQEKFVKQYYQNTGQRRANLFSSRGCPFNCRSCASCCVWSRRWRGRSAENITYEIKELIAMYNV